MFQELVTELANRILERKKETPLRVGIDGIDAAGKTVLANAIARYLEGKGHPVIHASIDGFHNPRSTRHQRGSYSPEGYFYDSFDYGLLKKSLLDPLAPGGNRLCCLEAFDFRTDTEISAGEIKATNAHVLIFEGVFLFRREIVKYWDLKILLDIGFETSLHRALERDLDLFGDEQEILKRYRERYIPGQKIYLALERPEAKADIIIHNDDFNNPVLTTGTGISQKTG